MKNPFAENNKVIWFFVGNPVFIASSRIHAWNIHQKLVSLGFSSYYAYLPAHIEEAIPLLPSDYDRFANLVQAGDVVVLQKLKNPINIPILQLFRNLKLRIVLIDCDLPVVAETARLVDLIICTSTALCDEYKKHGLQAAYIEDCPEFYYENVQKSRRDKLHCYWFGDGSPRKWKDVLQLKRILSSDSRLQNWELITISNHPDADIKWDSHYLQKAKEADVIAVPVFDSSADSTVKSANRVLQSMALSVPVICSPLPSYMHVVSSGKDGIVCATEDEWKQAFLQLQDETCRHQVAKAGFNTAQRYHIDIMIEQWIRVLGLSKSFKTSDKTRIQQMQRKLTQFFLIRLMKRNINYWNWTHATFSNTIYYLYLKGRIFLKRITNGGFLFWC
jgi:hypothetical protein